MRVLQVCVMLFVSLAVSAEPLVPRYTLRAADPQVADWFGLSVATNGQLIAVGVPGADSSGAKETGLVSVYDAATGELVYSWVPEDVTQLYSTGYDLASDSDTLLVLSVVMENSEYISQVHAIDFDTGEHIRTLRFPAGTDPLSNIVVGSFAVDGDTIAVGVFGIGQEVAGGPPGPAGKVYLYELSTGDLLHELSVADGTPGDYFGIDVSLDDGKVLVVRSTFLFTGVYNEIGFLFDVGSGGLLRALTADEDPDRYLSPFDASLQGGVALIGCILAGTGSVETGAVYGFDVSNGTQFQKFVHPGADEYDYLGLRVALDAGVAAGFTARLTSGGRSDRLYLFDPSDGRDLGSLQLGDDGYSGYAGISLAMSGDVVVIGDGVEPDESQQFGAVYVYDLTALPPVGDLDRDGLVGSSDLAVLLAAWGRGGVADLDRDGVVAENDVALLFSVWGCE